MKIFIALAAFAAITNLSGCATVGDLSRTGADELLPRPAIPSPHADFGASEGFKCETLPKSWGATTPSEVQLFERVRYCALIEDDQSLHYDTTKQANTDSPSRTYLARFVRQGMVLADAHCDVFLDAMEGKRTLTEFNLSNFNILAGVATAAMSKLGNHPQSLFNLATGAAAANSFADNYKANFLLTGTMHQLRDTVKQYRDELASASNLANPAAYSTYPEAQGDLREYASVCTHKGLVHLVNTKLAGSRFEANNLDKSAGVRMTARILTDAKKTDPTITKEAFAAGEFETIYEIAILETATRKSLITKLLADDKKLLKEKLPGLSSVVAALALEKDSPSALVDIVLAGRLLGYPLGSSETQKVAVAALVKAHVPAAPAAAASPAAAAGPQPPNPTMPPSAKATSVRSTVSRMQVLGNVGSLR